MSRKNTLETIKRLSKELLASERQRKEAQRLSGVGFWELNHITNELYWSEEIFVIYAIDPENIKPDYELFLSLIYESDKDLVNRTYQDSVKSGKQYDLRYRVKAAGEIKWIEARGITYYDKSGQPERSIGTAEDISEIINAQKQIEHMAYHDVLTGLANRKLFSDKLTEAISLAGQQGNSIAVLFIDLDNFKLINDTHGHDIGDKLLVSFAKKLEQLEQSDKLFARIGGDEFVGFISAQNDLEIDDEVKAVKQAIDGIYHIEMYDLHITVSIGVAVYPQDDVEPDTLLRHAAQAMYQVKQRSKSGIGYFDTEIFQLNLSRRNLLKDIEIALTNNEFELFFQPRIVLNDGQHAGAEALLRWFRPEGSISPTNIVEAIKNTSLEWELDKWVIENVLLSINLFKEQGLTGSISLNINPSSLQNPDFSGLLKSLLQKMNVDGHEVEIEILEVESFRDFDTARKNIKLCMELGVTFSLDDFGTGYSSLTHFHALPISKLKIDQSFIRTINTNPESLLLVKSILAIAKENNKPVIAEGVETEAIAHVLAELKCEFAQGYGIAMPMHIDEYIHWTKNRG